MVSGNRQRIIETNRSLRLIKNELETLLEKDILTDSAYESIMSLLPTESSLSATSVATMAATAATAPNPSLPIRNASPAAPVSTTEPVSNPPPAYSQTPVSAPAPPARQNSQPAAPPEKPILCKARALYKYTAQDNRDCSFDKDDIIHVYEYMNADWWMGRNSRTGSEGIFPRNYVEQVSDGVSEKNGAWPNEKAGAASTTATGAYPAPPPPGAGNPYNSDAPPMAIAEGSNQYGQGQGEDKDNKGKEMGKKFGKKLGNATIFGAGATMGSKIVDSIF